MQIKTAYLFNMVEISVAAQGSLGNPFVDVQLFADFIRPDGSCVRMEAFYDGESTYRVRAYCDQIGSWSWRIDSNRTELDAQQGRFDVVDSLLPGKLRLHPLDEQQFSYDNGDPFIHIGDTGYRYVADTEPYWRVYMDQAAAAGFTKIRVWFNQDRSDVQGLFTADRTRLNLCCWQEIDRRILYVMTRYPDLQLQLIPFGEDEEEVLRYGDGDATSRLLLRYTIARFSAIPNVQWCISNDFRLESGAKSISEREGAQRIEIANRIKSIIPQIGNDFSRLDPWGTLLTNHQSRFTGYSFTEEPWSNIITVEDLGQVTGEQIQHYRKIGNRPVVLDEDRYEHWKAPMHARYYFRRLLWSSLLSGGHASYGGLHTYRPFDGHLNGMYGYFDACRDGRLNKGAHDFIQIRRFFKETGFILAGAVPDDEMAGNKPLQYKVMRSSDSRTIIVYLANPTIYEGHAPDGFQGWYTDAEADSSTSNPTVALTMVEGTYQVNWFHPANGLWTREEAKAVATQETFTAPGGGDWVCMLLRKGGDSR